MTNLKKLIFLILLLLIPTLAFAVTEVDYMEYANDAAAQTAYPSSDTGTTATITQTLTGGTPGANITYGITAGYQDGFSQGFKVNNVNNISKFSFILSKSSGAVGTLTGYIYSDDGSGHPNASLATFSNIAVSTIATTPTYGWFDFTGSFTPTANTQYHIVLIWTGGLATVDKVYQDYTVNGYADGAVNTKDAATGWAFLGTGQYDYDFRVYQDYIHLQDYSEATIKSQGTYSLKAVALITDSLNDTLTRTVSPTIDLTGMSQIKLDMYASRTGSNIKIGIHDSGGTTTELTPSVSSANTWETKTWDISAVSDANKDVIDSVIITIVNADAANTWYIDNMFAEALGGYQVIIISD